MSKIDETTDRWVLEAKLATYVKALAEAVVEKHEASEAAIALAEEVHLLKEGVRGFATTLRDWAVRAGGHTPSAIIASRLMELIGDEKRVETEADVAMAKND